MPHPTRMTLTWTLMSLLQVRVRWKRPLQSKVQHRAEDVRNVYSEPFVASAPPHAYMFGACSSQVILHVGGMQRVTVPRAMQRQRTSKVGMVGRARESQAEQQAHSSITVRHEQLAPTIDNHRESVPNRVLLSSVNAVVALHRLLEHQTSRRGRRGRTRLLRALWRKRAKKMPTSVPASGGMKPWLELHHHLRLK
jgi:hypothetical protein